ncbi:MAG: hypothetical protein JWR72_2638 [Flavisolibacter sp.]|jgi:hypothetical protein|nr:hypothetical protein [Flavisolibacter sp.]
MKRLLTALSTVLLLASCQKEISSDLLQNNGGGGTGTGPGGGNGNGNTSGLLVKTVAITGSETQTTLYTYDSQKRLETMTISGTSGGMPVNSFHKYMRDGVGRITKVLQKIADMPGTTSDTAVKTFHYPNASTMNYDYSVHIMNMDMGGISMGTIDSSVYTYTSGKMMSYNSYMFSTVMPGSIMMNSKYDFTYDASDRVMNMKLYTDVANPNGAMDLDGEWKYTYGTSSVNNVYVAPSAAQNFALNGLPNTGTHVITKMETSSMTTSPPVNVVITTTYVNGAGNKPVSGTVVAVITGQPTQTTNYTFFYQ